MAHYSTALARLRPLDPGRIEEVGYHHDGGGLYLQVRKGRGGLTRSWIFRYTRHGKPRIMGLGPLGTIGLAEARKRAREARKLLLDDIDPIDARNANRAAQRSSSAAAITFRQASEAYIVAHRAGSKSTLHTKQWLSTFEVYVYPIFGNLPVESIDSGLVTEAIESILTESPERANRVRAQIESVLDWATARGYRHLLLKGPGARDALRQFTAACQKLYKIFGPDAYDFAVAQVEMMKPRDGLKGQPLILAGA